MESVLVIQLLCLWCTLAQPLVQESLIPLPDTHHSRSRSAAASEQANVEINAGAKARGVIITTNTAVENLFATQDVKKDKPSGFQFHSFSPTRPGDSYYTAGNNTSVEIVPKENGFTGENSKWNSTAQARTPMSNSKTNTGDLFSAHKNSGTTVRANVKGTAVSAILVNQRNGDTSSGTTLFHDVTETWISRPKNRSVSSVESESAVTRDIPTQTTRRDTHELFTGGSTSTTKEMLETGRPGFEPVTMKLGGTEVHAVPNEPSRAPNPEESSRDGRDSESNETVFTLTWQQCRQKNKLALTGHKGTVYGIGGGNVESSAVELEDPIRDSSPASITTTAPAAAAAAASKTEAKFQKEESYTSQCRWSIKLAPGFRFMHFLFTQLSDSPCVSDFRITASRYKNADTDKLSERMTCSKAKRRFFLDTGETFFHLSIHGKNDTDPPAVTVNPQFKLEFRSVKDDLRTRLNVTWMSASWGYVTQWGYDGVSNTLCSADASTMLWLPADHVMMLSFSRYHGISSEWNRCPDEGLWLSEVTLTPGGEQVAREGKHWCHLPTYIDTQTYTTPLLLRYKTARMCSDLATGFKALFSFHPASRAPQKVATTQRFNCSEAGHYDTFRQHLHCNLLEECHELEDEGGFCPYSSAACGGFIASGNKCYRFVSSRHVGPTLSARLVCDHSLLCKDRQYSMSHHAAHHECRKLGAKGLATMKTVAQWRHLTQGYHYGKHVCNAMIGVRSGDRSFPDLYRHTLKWFDNSIALSVDVRHKGETSRGQTHDPLRVSPHSQFEQCGVVVFGGSLTVQWL